MSDSKISNLSSATTPLTGSELAVVVQGGDTKQISVANLLAGVDNLGTADLTIDSSGSRKLILGGALSTDKFTIRNSADTADLLEVRGNGFSYIENILFVGSNSSTQGALRVYGGAGASSQIFNVYNSSNAVVHEFRQSANAAEFNMLDASGTNQFKVITSSNDMLQLGEARNIKVGTTTGTKIASSTSQKLGFWDATPVVQPDTSITAGTFVANTSGISDDSATFDGYTIGQIAAALKQIGILA